MYPFNWEGEKMRGKERRGKIPLVRRRGEGDEEGEKRKTEILGKEPSHAPCYMIEPSKLIVGNLHQR